MGRLLAIGVVSAAVGIGAGILAANAVASSVTLEATAVDYHRCPGDIGSVGEFHRGDRVFAVAADSSGDWLAVRSPQGDSEVVWIASEHLIADGAITGLPIASCPGAVPSPATTIPDTTTSTAGGTTTTTTTAPTTTSIDSTPPTITGVLADPTEIYEEYLAGSSSCITGATATIHVTTSGGAAAVTVRFTVLGDVTTVNADGSGGAWTATLGPYPYGELPVPVEGADIAVVVTAVDGSGNATTAGITVHLHSAGECLG